MLLTFLFFACTSAMDCDACEEDELCVAHIDEAEATQDFATCEPVPAECGATLDCEDNTCVADAYGRCSPGFVGGLCDADGSPALTCFAETQE